ncbi:GATA transcription factor 8-like [Argentina anserina]|uniref:GATA transcription factor 8-like n=1 Tax=Argentina anserina TaxID=57926 RepID=UPI0021768034|nr:GATA transcription factor 8-like [Potentilla anserina]
MITPAFVDEIDCGSFFDNIDDLMEDVDSILGPAPDCNSSPFSLWPANSSAAAPLPPSDAAVFSGNGESDFSSELPVPFEEMVHLEWLSNFVENSEYSGGNLTMNKQQEASLVHKESSHQQFQTSSPISVLDSSSSCSGEKNVLEGSIPPGRRGRARSKRPRPPTFNPRSAIQLISPASSVSEIDNPLQQHSLFSPKVFSDSENFAESCPVVKMQKQASGEQKKKKRVKLPLQVPGEVDENSPVQGAVRKCLHCEITKTPQWRAGPMGPKTLCNACGVRYKSGRLFPEYRPAASPTFVPALHSNSHKKVIEMRTKGGEMVSVRDNSIPEFIPNTNSIISLDYM